MSHRGKGLLGVLALTLGALGAAELAFGQDLASTLQLSMISVSNHDVNRTGKADRAPRVTTPLTPTQTVSVTLSGLADTSVVMRIPLAQDVRNTAPASILTTRTTPILSKPTVACEPVVSVLTDVAKQLQPGRCVT
jgi:hypothetical protein